MERRIILKPYNKLAKNLTKYFVNYSYNVTYPTHFHFLPGVDFLNKLRETKSNSWSVEVCSLGLYTYSQPAVHEIWIRKLPVRVEYAVVCAIFHELIHCRNKEMRIMQHNARQVTEMQKDSEKIAESEGLMLASRFLGVEEETIDFAMFVAGLFCSEIYLSRNSSQREFMLYTKILNEFLRFKGPIELNLLNSINLAGISDIIKRYDASHCHNYLKKLREIEPFIRKMDDIICCRF